MIGFDSAMIFFLSFLLAAAFTGMTIYTYRGWAENRFLRNSRNCLLHRNLE